MKAKHARSSQNILYLILLIVTCILVIAGYFVYQHLNKEAPPADETDTTTAVTTTTTTTVPTTTTTVTQVAITPHIGDNGNWWIGETDTGVKAVGTDGEDGITPHIGDNGNWWIGETDTGVSATIAPTTTTTSTIATTTTTKAPTKPTSTSATAAVGSVSFADTLFIGDSRTHGLSLYGKISDADFFAYTSLSSFTVLKNTVDVKGVGKVTLEQLLSQETYKTVYIMLGINEIGYSMSNIVKQYEAIIAKVKEKQPNAIIVLQSTLHVRADKQNTKKGITNDRINTLNTHLADLANNTNIFYLDLNPVFDDGNGAMDKQYSNDGVHFYSKYYPLWRDFLANNRP